MTVKIGNLWYFFWILLAAGAIVGLYFLLRKRKPWVQKTVLFSLLALGLTLHFLKLFIYPYWQARDEFYSVFYSESWFVNICGANIALFPFLFFSKNKYVKDYMFYIGVLSGFLAIIYPTEALNVEDAKKVLDILRFYYHHWMLLAVPLLTAMLNLHRPSYKRIWTAPAGMLAIMLFIILNQFFQSELGFIKPRGDELNAFENWRNNSFIYGPDDGIGAIFKPFVPKIFKTIPVGPNAGTEKYWPWFWAIVPLFVLVSPFAFFEAMIFDAKNFVKDIVKIVKWIVLLIKKAHAKLSKKSVKVVGNADDEIAPTTQEETPLDLPVENLEEEKTHLE